MFVPKILCAFITFILKPWDVNSFLSSVNYLNERERAFKAFMGKGNVVFTLRSSQGLPNSSPLLYLSK